MVLRELWGNSNRDEKEGLLYTANKFNATRFETRDLIPRQFTLSRWFFSDKDRDRCILVKITFQKCANLRGYRMTWMERVIISVGEIFLSVHMQGFMR